MTDPAYPLIALMVVSLVLIQLNQRYDSPILAILNRWLRWLIFAFGAAYIVADFEWIDRPYWVLVGAFFLVWFLGETLYNWLAISALSLSPLPLFPRYQLNPNGDEWPTHKRFLRIRDWLRANGFKSVQPLRAELAQGIYLRASVYQDADAKLRVQVVFFPAPGGTITVSYVLTSITAGGFRYVTDNLHIPFGGFYPEDWSVERLPWTRGLSKLVARHRTRLTLDGMMPVSFSQEPLADINLSQHQLDQLNTEMGFLVAQPEREERGKITQQGRYRVWKEIWTLDYFGRSARYQ